MNCIALRGTLVVCNLGLASSSPCTYTGQKPIINQNIILTCPAKQVLSEMLLFLRSTKLFWKMCVM